MFAIFKYFRSKLNNVQIFVTALENFKSVFVAMTV